MANSRCLSRKKVCRRFKVLVFICVCFPFMMQSVRYWNTNYMFMVVSIKDKIQEELRHQVSPTYLPTGSQRGQHLHVYKTNTIKSLVDIPWNFNVTHVSTNTTYTILWFNAAGWINTKVDMSLCEYDNCLVTHERTGLHNSSVIIFGTSMTHMGIVPPISPTKRNPDQIWVHYSLEAPIYHVYQTDYKTPAWHNALNWSMNFNLDADVFAPYGTFKTKQFVKDRDYNKIYDMKTKVAVWVVSNCGSMSRRNEYVKALQAAGLKVDIYGACGPLGRYQGDIKQLAKNYKFYLSFENSFCKFYVTEKVIQRFNYDTILVLRGGANYSELLPPKTYVDVAMFPDVSQLVTYLHELASDRTRYIDYLRQKGKYDAFGEDNFGYPYAMCNLCKKLNTFGGKRKVYGDLKKEVLKEGRCLKSSDIKFH